MSTIDLNYVRDQLFRLISIDSRNPVLTTGAPGENQIGEYIFTELRRLGIDAQFQETSDPGRRNVIGYLPGNAGGSLPSLMLNGHMDTVNVVGMEDPFTPVEQDGLVYGRGSQDMKGSLAVMLGIAACLTQTSQKPPRDISLAFVVDEEGDSAGTEALVKENPADQAIILEPTDLQVAIAHRGFAWYQILSEGKAAHGSRYEEGIDAIANLGTFMQALQQLASDLISRPNMTLAGPPSLHASTIKGGTELSVYPAQCELTIERRTSPEENPTEVSAEIQDLVNAANRKLGADVISMRTLQVRAPFQAFSGSPLLSLLLEARAAQNLSGTAESSVPFWTDAAILAEAGCDCVVFGPHGFGLHSAEEWVSMESLSILGSILLHVIWNSRQPFTSQN